MKRCKRGFTLIELAVVGMVMSSVLVAAWSVFEVLKRSQLMVEGRTDARAQLRAAFNRLTMEFNKADFILTNQTVFLGGQTFVLPDLGSRGVNDAGNLDAGFVVAIPKGPDPDPSLATAVGTYDVVAVKTVPRPVRDSRNPNARSILLLKWIDRSTGNIPNPTAAALDYSALGPPQLRKVYDTYILPGGFSVMPTRPLNSVSLVARFTKDVSAGAGASVDKVDGAKVGGIGLEKQSEQHSVNIMLRNSI
jgi:prepilin-type N-terminal cleavage/methylation domain-containing protein